jgi:hypothetical protein
MVAVTRCWVWATVRLVIAKVRPGLSFTVIHLGAVEVGPKLTPIATIAVIPIVGVDRIRGLFGRSTEGRGPEL